MQPAHTRPAHNHSDVDIDLPCIDGMLAGTLALMTGYAEHQCEQGNAQSRYLMAKKIVSNLFFLASHPQMPAPLAAVMRNLQTHWHTLTALGALESNPPSAAEATTPSALWMAQHPSVQ
jgi:hypothetical protein